MTDRPIFDAADPDAFFYVQMAALKSRKTLFLNLDDVQENEVPENISPYLERDYISQVFAETPLNHTAITLHTSGSTGKPKAVPHTWGHLMGDAAAIAKSVGITADANLSTILTVPLNHMLGYSYGFMLTNLFGFDRPRSRVVSPKSLLNALNEAKNSVILVTTPTHLKNYVESKIETFPYVSWIFCATSQLPTDLNAKVNEKFGTHITDIYGCTEAGTLAYRNMSRSADEWHCLEGMALSQKEGRFIFETEYFDEPVIIDDVLQITSPQSFEFIGRSSDLVKLGGKRQSLAGLACLVEEIPNVREAKFYLPASEPNARMVLFAAFEGPENFAEIRDVLSKKIDPVFLPRQTYEIDALPYTENGKFLMSDLDRLYKEKSGKGAKS